MDPEVSMAMHILALVVVGTQGDGWEEGTAEASFFNPRWDNPLVHDENLESPRRKYWRESRPNNKIIEKQKGEQV